LKKIKIKIKNRISFLKLNTKSKDNLSEKVMDLGNIAFGSLYFSQLTSVNNFNIAIALLGIFVLIFSYLIAIMLLKEI